MVVRSGGKRLSALFSRTGKSFLCWTSLVVVTAAVGMAGGCGKGSAKSASYPAGAVDSANGSLEADVDAATAGSITGTVVLDGAPPSLPAINMQSEPACAKANPTGTASQAVVVGSGGDLANAVVYVKQELRHYRYETPKDPVVLDQKGCLYQPRVVGLMTNQPLEIRNSDATIHNVHAIPKNSVEWNRAQRAGSALIETSFQRPELAIPFMCNVHPWMRAFVFVFDHPYFSVTGGDGKFELKNLPPGTYTIEAWQEKLGTRGETVTLAPRESKQVTFRFNSGGASH